MERVQDKIAFGEELGQISAFEFENGRPMLSCVVFNLSQKMPGKGYFRLAQTLYSVTFRSETDRYLFFAKELRDTIDYWKKLKKRS